MTIIFGLEFDDVVFPVLPEREGVTTIGDQYLGPKGLLLFLEGQLGIADPGSENDYLRIEQYRQYLSKHLVNHPQAFFADSFEADQLGTAITLLEWRDELILGGAVLSMDKSFPERIKVIAQLEIMMNQAGDKPIPGPADRFSRVIRLMEETTIEVDRFISHEPINLFPTHIQRAISLIKSKENTSLFAAKDQTEAITDLDHFRHVVSGKSTGDPIGCKADGSLVVLKFKRETEGASWLASFFRQNPQFRPLCLIPEKNRMLDNAVVQEGLPSMGILSESVVRPTLQVLKLVSAFLWEPVDPFKVMEFVSLSMVPLDNELAAVLAEQIAKSPGLNSDRWKNKVNQFFRELEERNDEKKDIRKIRYEYNLWFQSPRFDISGTVPVDIVIEKFSYLSDWGLSLFKDGGKKHRSLLVLSDQARKIKEILEALPPSDAQLTSLQIERIVRTVYEPSPVSFLERKQGHLPFIHFPSAIAKLVDDLVWWNFTDQGPDNEFNKWYTEEIEFFARENIYPVFPSLKQEQRLWAAQRPIKYTQKRLFLVVPESVEGKAVHPHSMMSDLVVAFKDFEKLMVDPINADAPLLNAHFNMPQLVTIEHEPLGKAKPYLQIRDRYSLINNEKESYTSLDSLFYYPYQWVFRHQARLRKSNILSVVKEPTLMGNLAHSLFEMMFQKDIHSWNRQQTETWISQKLKALFREEGSVFLLYGKEPERVNFENKLKYAGWTLVRLIQENGWEKIETEVTLEGKFMGVQLKGIADMVLTRGSEKAIVDLKWRGGKYRENLIRNKEDLQLVLYSRLLGGDESWAHTAYFIIDTGTMIARNNLAFKEAVAVSPDADHSEVNQEIWAKMENTYTWRKSQLEKGMIEIRTEDTSHILDEAFSEDADYQSLLEMKDGDAPFDDFKTLIGLLS
ncbi:MAG: PD-(D/E)XK nuclease family protein [Bacteroidota bacterium]